jgi:ribokinase
VKPAVVIVGSYNHDHVWRVDRFPTAGETRRGEAFLTNSGGKGFNQAVACARQGVMTAFVAACGDDAIGALAREAAQRAGVHARWQVAREHATGTAAVLVDASGQNQIIVALGANEHLDPAFVRAQDDAFAEAKIVLVQLENNLDATASALEAGTRHRLMRMLNPAPVHAQLKPALLLQVDILTPNETEFALLLERFVGERVDPAALANRSDADLHTLARKLGAATVIITLGAHGCFVSHGDDRRGDATGCYRLPPEQVRAIDTTGAGDAFSGALAAALVRFDGQAFRDSAVHANRVAAMSTETVGAAAAMPTLAAVEQRFGA